ncbi:hypothetical protein T439DRAFT_152752 [Meredithblackwellia eburnea MCA 4105]
MSPSDCQLRGKRCRAELGPKLRSSRALLPFHLRLPPSLLPCLPIRHSARPPISATTLLSLQLASLQFLVLYHHLSS